MQKKTVKIKEIEGLRLLMALQVAIYHIWIQKVSGGVDVFFVITGFLITISLMRRYDRDGMIYPINFTTSTIKRLFPNIFIVIIFTVFTYPFVAQNFEPLKFIKETIAALTYTENWYLIFTQNSYLDRSSDSAIFKHLWATSVQAQFYIIWSIALLLLIRLFKVGKNINIKFIFFVFSFIIVGLSLLFSIYYTNVNQISAYYNIFTRLYEFSVGAMLAIIFSKLKVNNTLAIILSYIGFIVIFIFGIFVNVGSTFPSYLALIPTISVVFILIASKANIVPMPNKLLSNKILNKYSYLAYPIYLWHWILYIYYYNIFENFNPSFLDGVIILIMSIVLAFLGGEIINKNKSYFKRISIFIVVVAVSLVIIAILNYFNSPKIPKDINLEDEVPTENYLISEDYPGALINEDGYADFDDTVKPKPDLSVIKTDIGTLYKDNCNQTEGKDEVIECEYGNKDSSVTIAVVGGSHTVQWLDSVKLIAEHRGIRVVTMTKLACRFTDDTNVDDDCIEWNKNVMDKLISEDIDIVFTNADISEKDIVGIPKGYLRQFKKLEEEDIKVLALRDTPWLESDIVSCLENNNSSDCAVEKDKVLVDPGYWEQLDSPPSNVEYLDLTDKICKDNLCSPVQGNIYVYWDSHHLTSTYAKTLTPYIDEKVVEMLKER